MKMDDEIQLVSDGDGLAVIGELAAGVGLASLAALGKKSQDNK